MGRYDKIKVYHNNGFSTPSRVQVYHNNAWVDLGTNNDKTKTSDLKVRYNNAFSVATKKWTKIGSHEEVVDVYSTGTFTVSPSSGYCYRTTQNDWQFACDAVRKTGGGDQNIFQTGTSNNYVKIIWGSDGRIHTYVKSSYYGSEQHLQSGNTFGNYSWISINVYQSKNTNTFYLYVNGNLEASSNYGTNYNWNISNATNTASDSYINMKGNLTVKGVSYSSGAQNTSGDMSNYASMYTEKRTVDDYDWR